MRRVEGEFASTLYLVVLAPCWFTPLTRCSHHVTPHPCSWSTSKVKDGHLPCHSPANVSCYEDLYSRGINHDLGGKPSVVMDGSRFIHTTMRFSGEERPISSTAHPGPWGHSIYSLFRYIPNNALHRGPRSTLTRFNPGRTTPQIQSGSNPSEYGVQFQKCAQVMFGADPPLLTFLLLIHNLDRTELSQVAIRDSISGVVPLTSEGKVLEKDFQTFTIDSLPAGSQHVVNYTAHIRSYKSEVLDLPAFLSFSNASQNDVHMFDPLRANLTLRVNSTDRIHPSHAVHFAGFICGFIVTLVMLTAGFLATNLICSQMRLNLLQQRKNRADSDPEYGDWTMSETTKDEAAFEDKMVDIMVLEDPQNMYQALENLEMSSLLWATANLEASRVQIYQDLTVSLLGSLRSRGQASAAAQQRLLNVLHGQLLGMEGRLKEERAARMAALAGQCNLETREEMEVEHHREAAEKANAELLCQHADQQDLLQCSVLLEKLHKLNQSQLQRTLLVRHEEASAKVQRQIIEWRRMELHKIFSEELEEATRMGEMEKSTAMSLQHDYFACQDQLEEVLDVAVANQRFLLAERHAQRKFLVRSLHSLKSLISDIFSSTSSHLDSWFNTIRRGCSVPAVETERLQDKALKELMTVRQRLEETLSQERRAMHCGLVKKRRELISEMLQGHKQRQRNLSDLSKGLEERLEVAQRLSCWQNLLTAQSLELAELINNLDEEAAADIRKVTMRVIQSAMAEVKAIQPSAVQALLNLWPPGAPRTLLQIDPEPELGQGAGTLQQAQEKLHQEGKAAVCTLRCTREALQQAMDRELKEQRELRAQSRAFFGCLCSSQLTLSEDDKLKMKLEFQKCLSVMDRCLVLPHAVSRAKLHAALASWRKEMEQQTENTQKKTKKPADTAKLPLFQKKLEERIQLFEKEKEMESSVMDKVLKEMGGGRERDLRSRSDALATQMATVHFQKAERRTKVLETSRAMLTLHSLLSRQLREGRQLDAQGVAQSIHNHCSGLEEAEQQLQEERASLSRLEEQARPAAKQSEEKKEDDSDEEEDSGEGTRLFQVRRDLRMVDILQGALHKSDQISTVLKERSEESTARFQAVEDLKEQLELKRLYAHCDQDLEFASQLVKQSQVSTEVLLEALRLLLPTLPESELLSVVDALRPKHNTAPCSAEHDHQGSPRESSRNLLLRLKEDMMCSNVPTPPGDRLQMKRQAMSDKLFPALRRRDVAPLQLEESGERGSLPKSTLPEDTSAGQHRGGAAGGAVGSQCNPPVAPATSAPAAAEPSPPPAAGRLFVFRVPPEPPDAPGFPPRKRKRNFLNLKKGSVAPTNLP